VSAAEPRTWIATSTDLDAVAALLGEFRNWFGNTRPTDVQMRASVERIHAEGEGDYLLAARGDGEPEGVCQLRFRWSVWTSSHDAWLEDLFVRESARGLGLGRLLLEAAIDHACARGCARIELDVDEGNEPALALYLANGFIGDAKADVRSLLLGRALVPTDEPPP
jgi:GNAT superfamily N-acetyltransferase